MPTKTSKKVKYRNQGDQEPDYLFYKYEEENLVENSEISFIYKIPLQEKNLGFLENANEPQYKFITLIKYAEFVKTIGKMQNN